MFHSIGAKKHYSNVFLFLLLGKRTGLDNDAPKSYKTETAATNDYYFCPSSNDYSFADEEPVSQHSRGKGA